MRVTKAYFTCVLVLAVLAGCSKKNGESWRFAKVGGKTFSYASYQAFSVMEQQYPSQLSETSFPGRRMTSTFLVETEVLYRTAKWGGGALKHSGDWQWKQRYFPAQLYMQDVVNANCGFTDKEVEAYYTAHRDSFKVVRRIPHAPAAPDTSKGAKPALQIAQPAKADSARDTVVYTALGLIRDRVISMMFLDKYPPDSAFYASARDTTKKVVDTAALKQRWYQHWRRDALTFFTKKEYQKQVGRPMPDSLKDWYGKGKLITPNDMDVILNWLGEDRRASYQNEAGTKYLAEWLLKWKLFEAAARRTGYANQEKVKETLRWAWKYEVVSNYVSKKLLPRVDKDIQVDTAMCVYAYWDDKGTPGVMPDTAGLHSVVTSYQKKEIEFALDKVISQMRQKVGVKFLMTDWTERQAPRDEKDGNPVAMMAQADSALAANDSHKAESKYTDVSRDFPYTEQGLKALSEMAKIETENGSYRDAVKNYRDYLILSKDTEHRYNTFFMIGFIYDEYLSKPAQAEIQYKWILKNAPKCELADDAEFMCQHLDEPMTSVEELQAEARRQGRKIDDTKAVGEMGDSTGIGKVKPKT